MKSSIWQLLYTVKLMVKILSIFLAFSENVNFTYANQILVMLLPNNIF